MSGSGSESGDTFRIEGVVYGAAVCGVVGILFWALYDAWLLSHYDVSFWRGWMASAAHGVGVAALAVPVVAGLLAAAHRTGWWDRLGGAPRRYVAIGTAGAVACVAFGASLLGASLLYRRLFASRMVQMLAIAMSGPVIGVVWGAAGSLLFRGLDRVLRARCSRETALRFGWLLPSLPLVAAAAAFPFVAPKVTEALAWNAYLPVAVAAGSTAAGGLLGRRWIGRPAAVAAVVAAVGVAGAHLFVPHEKSLKVALQRKTSGAAYLSSQLGRWTDSSTSTSSSKSRSGGGKQADGGTEDSEASPSCFPDADPPREKGIGEVGDEAPNIILVVSDAIRWDHTSMSGYEHDTTPNMAEHAEEGAVFEQAYSAASNSRQSYRGLFTGIYPSIIGTPESTKWGTSFRDEHVTIAELLRGAGYHTVAISSQDRTFPAKHGALDGFEEIDRTPIPVENEKGRTVSFKFDRIISHLSDPDVDKPQFVWTHLLETHQPYPNGPHPITFDSGRYSKYDSAIRFVDTQMKRLLNFARGPTRRDDTIVIFTADHGQAFKEHGVKLHGQTTYQEEIHVPFLFWGPEVDAGRYDTPVSTVDVVPTLLDVLGLSVAEGYCGKSLADTLHEGASPPSDPVYVESIPDDTRDYFATAFVDAPHKLMVNPTAEAAEVYNLEEDPGEQKDLSSKKPELRERLLDDLWEFYEARNMDPSFYNLDTIRE